MTNYERIREMSVEEMAEILSDSDCEKRCGFTKDGKCNSYGNSDMCAEGVALWLNSEAEGLNKFVFTESMMKDCIQKIENATQNIPIRKIEFVIRCKNCRYYYATNNVCHRLITVFRMEPEDFCSYGERKEEE